MILSDEEIEERMQSPINLMNRLKELSIPKAAIIPSLPSPKAENIIPNIDDKLNNTRAKANAILNATMDELRRRLPEVRTPEKLSVIAKEMSQVIVHQDTRNLNNQSIQAGTIVIYSPTVQPIENYEIIEVEENAN